MNITDSINHWHTYQAFNKTLYPAKMIIIRSNNPDNNDTCCSGMLPYYFRQSIAYKQWVVIFPMSKLTPLSKLIDIIEEY